jgi:hypothetical protein
MCIYCSLTVLPFFNPLLVCTVTNEQKCTEREILLVLEGYQKFDVYNLASTGFTASQYHDIMSCITDKRLMLRYQNTNDTVCS